MQRYDFTEKPNITGAVYDEIGKMSGYELSKVHEAIACLRKEVKEERRKELSAWFAQAIVPSLKEVAQSVGAVLEIDNENGEITACIKREDGFELYLDTNRLRMALYLADAISVETMGEKAMLTLVYDTERLIK